MKREIAPDQRMNFFTLQSGRLTRLKEICRGIQNIITELERRRSDDQKPIDERIFAEADGYATELIQLVSAIATAKIET